MFRDEGSRQPMGATNMAGNTKLLMCSNILRFAASMLGGRIQRSSFEGLVAVGKQHC